MPIAGVKPEIVGPPLFPVTVKEELLVDDPLAVTTVMGPVVAPAGTVTVSCVALAALTVACVPLKRTVFWLGVALKPTPEMVTVVPTGPCPGLKSAIRTAVAA